MEIKDLNNNELIKLIKSYDRYIQDANETNEYFTGWRPVCIEEYLNNEFLEEIDNE